MHLVEMIVKEKQGSVVSTFLFGDAQVRVLRGENGEPWFVGKDVAQVLGYANVSDALAKHCKAPRILTSRNATFEIANRGLAIIPERDVYRLIMRSRLPAAERFEEWVVGEVLPSIRRKGGYSLSGIGRKELAQMVLDAETERENLAVKVTELTPKAEGYDLFMSGENTQTMAQAAKVLGTGRTRLFSFLRNRKILQNNNIPYQRYIERGYFKVVEKPITMGGKNRNYVQTVITPKGLDFVRTVLFIEKPALLAERSS